MAYNGNAGRYQQAQYGARPQGYAGQNGYAQGQHPTSDAAYQDVGDQRYQDYQQEAFGSNQQYTQNYVPPRDQSQSRSQYQAGVNGGAGAPEAQPRSYQYDDRYRNGGRQEAQYGGRAGAPSGRRSPQSRPGTAASGRRTKQERILDSAELDSPKAMAWDNPFGVFPGTKKDAEQKRKATEESRSRSRAETPSDRPPTSFSRPATAAGSREVNPVMTRNQSLDEPRPHTSHSTRLDSVNNGPPNTQYGQVGNMPIRQKRTPENGPQYNTSAAPNQAMSMDPQTFKQNLPVRSAPQRSIPGPGMDRQPVSPPVPSANYDSQSRGPYGMNQYPDEHPQRLPARNGNGYPEETYDLVANQPDNTHQFNFNENAQSRADTWVDPQRERRGQTANRTGGQLASDAHDFGNSNGHFEYRGVKSSRSVTDLNDPVVPNFAAMPTNATENIERQVTLQSQQSYSAYQKPTYGQGPSRPQPQEPAQSFRQDAVPVPEPDYRAGPQSPPMQHGDQGDYNQQNFPPRKGSRPEARRGPSDGFRHPYNQPDQSRSPAQYPKSPPRGPPLPKQPRQPGRRAPRQDYGFDDQGYPSGNRYDPNPYYEDPSYEPYPREQGRTLEQPPALIRSQTEPMHQPYDDQYDQAYRRRGPPTRTQTLDTGYDQYPSSPPQTRRPKQYDQGQGYDQSRYAPPSRPRTANATRTPMNQYPEQFRGPGNAYPDPNMPRGRPPNSAFPMADRNHPVPVRPGLMSPPPPPPQAPIPMPVPQSTPTAAQRQQAPPPQVSPPRTQHNAGPPPQNSQPQKLPVTTRELSELRDAFNSNPNDAKIGLKFVKKSVEAASVLANEGGRADPKTAARNRERYINDAYKVVKKLVSNGSSDAMFYLADCYGTGQLGLEVNPKEAFQLYTSAAKMGHAQAAYRVAVCCEMGSDGGGGTRRDHVKAVQFYKKAATLGDVPAMFKMGAILMKGLLGQPPNRREGVQWLKRAAERADAENPHALHELGSLYENAKADDVIIEDERYALELFTRAANLGYKHSQARLGAAYEYGLMGCTIDPQTSIMWYSKAASQGEHLAEFALSGWYLTGAPPLLQASDQEAYLWARKAASSGLAKAEYAMGYYTETGIGTAPNVEEAKKWYFRAAAQNDERARSRLEEFKRGAGRKERGRVSRSGVGRQNEGECAVM